MSQHLRGGGEMLDDSLHLGGQGGVGSVKKKEEGSVQITE